MLELKWAEAAPGEWAVRCIAPLRSLRGLAAKLDDPSVGAAIDALLELLKKVEPRSNLQGNLREDLLRTYAALREKIPAAPDPELELRRRDPALVDALLTQVDGVHYVAIDKIYAAGFRTTGRFLRATAEELDSETGIGPELAARIVASFRAFRSECATLAADPSRSEDLRLLSGLLDELRLQQTQFEQACARFAEEDLRSRRVLRGARLHTLRRVYALLARLGEVERIASLERAPFRGKILELTAYVRSVTPSAAQVS